MPSSSLKESLEKRTEKYYNNLRDHKGAQAYLKSRGLSGEIARYFRLGVSTPAENEEDEQGNSDKLVIPYITRAGVVTLRFRRLPVWSEEEQRWNEPFGAKYKSITGAPPRLYNVNALFDRSDLIVICEGEFDAITVHSLVDLPCVGVAGINCWDSLVFPLMLKNYTRHVFIKDSDPIDPITGERPGDLLAEKIRKDIPGLQVVQLPEGYDANKYVLEFGPEKLGELIG